MSCCATSSPTAGSVEHVVVVGGTAGAGRRDRRSAASCTRGTSFGAADDAPTAEPGVIDIDMAAILYTSGSTGKPKGVVLCHRNLIAGAESVSQYLGNTADDVILAALPLSFDAGFSQLTTAFTVGAHVVLHELPAAGRRGPACAPSTGSPGLTCVPPLWIQLADQEWPEEATRSAALLRQHRRADAQADARQAAGDLPAAPSHFSCTG